MGSPVRFLFDNDFAAPPPEPEPVEQDVVEEVPTIELEVHLEELRKAEAAAREAGFAEGERSAVSVAQQQLAQEAQRVADAADRMITLFDGELRKIEKDATVLAATIAHKLANHLLDRFPDDKIFDLVTACLAPLRSVRHLAVRVNEADAGRLREPIEELAAKSGFEGRLLILGEPDTKPGDCRIEWADGGILYERQAVLQEINDAIRTYLGDDAIQLEDDDAADGEIIPADGVDSDADLQVELFDETDVPDRQQAADSDTAAGKDNQA